MNEPISFDLLKSPLSGISGAAFAPAQVPNSSLQVSVGFADSSTATANFPEPWNETNPNINFSGAGTVYRAGAIRLDNSSGTAVAVDSVVVDLGRPGPVFQLWTNITVPANGSAILTQTADGNFNTSASPILGCGQTLVANESRIPKVTVTIGGQGTDYLDTAHVLDTGGFDSSCRGNQSLQWRPIGTLGIANPAGSIQLSAENAPHAVGTQNTFNIVVNDADNQPLANVPLVLKVVNGPNSGRSFSGTTDSTGNAIVQYSSAAQGTDLLQAVIGNLSGGSAQSQQVSTTWTSAAACPPPAAQNPATTHLIYIGQSTMAFGNPVQLSALLTDGTGNPLGGRPVSFAFTGQTVTAGTDANGTAKITAASLPVGPTAITMNFAGDQNFQPSQLSSTVTVQPAATLLRYMGANLLTSLGQQTITALLTDAQGRTPIPNRTVTFLLNGASANAVSNNNGVATTAFNFQTAQPTGLAQLQISFAGDADYRASSRTATVEVYQSTGFVIWGGNSGGLKVGQQVNFWGAQWANQVTGGQWGANASFKGFADTVETSGIQQCQPKATTSSLNPSCWTAKPGNSSPPATLANTIGVIVSTAIDKSGSTIFGNIACGALVKVNASPAYAPDPGHPGFGTVIAVNGDCAGVFPQPVVLQASQQQPSPVLPTQQTSVTYTIANQGGTDATNVTLTENFDQLAPATGSASVGTIAAGQSVSGSFSVTVPPISGRQAGESSVDYESRLAASDGRLFTAEGEINFTDPFAQLYPPLDFSSFSQLSLPRLQAGLSGATCIAPGASVPYQVRIDNLGSATGQRIAAALTLPDSTTTSLTVPDLPSGMSFAGTVNWKAPGIAAKSSTESTQAYLARLASFDGVTLPATVIGATWQDQIGNSYGPVEQLFSSLTQRVPIVSTTVPGAQPLLPNQKTQFSFTATNTGSGNAVQVTLTLRRQDGTQLIIPNFSLPGGQSGVVTANYSAPAIQAKGATESDAAYLVRLAAANTSVLNLDAILGWTDSANNSYGPTDNPFTATEQLPVLSLAAPIATTALPGQTVPLVFTVANSGSAAAQTAVLKAGGAAQTISALSAGQSQTVATSFAVSSIPAKGAGESDAAYLSRLQAADNQAIPVSASLSWSDAANNTYGPISAATQITQLLPVINLALVAQGAATDGNTIVFAATLTNSGHASATLASVSFTLPDGSVAQPPLSVTTLAPGASTTVSARFTIPVNQPAGALTANTTATWTDAAANSYGPISASASISLTQMNNRPPVVNAGPSQTITLPANATLNGSATENGVAISTVSWSKIAGPGQVTFTNAASTSTQASFSAPGTYILELNASAPPFTGVDDVTIMVKPAVIVDNSFAVSAGPNQTVTFPGTATLNGTTSSSNGPLTTTWSQVDGPATVTFANAASPATTATFSTPGTYILRLTATDSLKTGASDVTVFVGKLACTRSTAGTDFWLVFAASTGSLQEAVTLNISSDVNTSGTVSIPGLQFTQDFIVTAGQATTITIPTTAVMRSTDQVESKGVHVTAQAPVTIHALDFIPAASDGFTALPTASLGTDYVTVGYKNGIQGSGFSVIFAETVGGGEFAVVATQDNTTVTITPSERDGTTGRHAAKVPYQITLNQGQTYQLQNLNGRSTDARQNETDGDLSGSTITSDKPVAVVSGHECAFVPSNQAFCNLLEEEIPPSDLWGKNFVTMPLATRLTGGDLFRFVAAHDGTNLQINGTQAATLNRGDFFDASLAQPSSITADQPILVAQMAKGGTIDGIFDGFSNTFTVVRGDPFMVLVPPYDQFGGSYTVVTPQGDFPTNYLNVVAPTAGLNDTAITLDGSPLPAASFAAIDDSGFSGVQIPVSIGSHHLASTSIPFSLTAYGFGVFEGYGYYGGACFASAASGTQVALTPKSLTAQIDSQSCVNISSSDAAGKAVGGIGVQLAITGVNPQKTFVTTDATGTGKFCYTGLNPGSDLIVASTVDGQLSDTASFTWTTATTNHAPIVNAGKDITIFLPQNTVTLQGSVVDTDGLPPGAPINIQWSVVGGNPLQVSFSNPQSAVTQATFTAPGVYTLQLEADDTQLSSAATVHVTVNPPNQAPVVNAGPPQILYSFLFGGGPFPVSTTLQGSASDDGLPNGTLTTQWSVFSGPAAVGFANTASPITTASFTIPGVYVLALTANDSQLSTTALLQVTVLVNQPPVVTVADQTIISAGPVTATVSAQVTDDGLPLNGHLTIQWIRWSGLGVVLNPTQATTQVQLPGPGFYTFRIDANDGQLDTTQFANINVLASPPPPPPPPPAPPLVSITAPSDQADIHSPVQVIGNVSNGNWTLAYRLNTDEGTATTTFTTLATGSGPVSNGVLATFDPSVLVNGVYTLQLTSIDTNNQTGAAAINVILSRNRKLGFFTISFNDLSVPMPGLPIQIVRTYDSRNLNPGDFSFGWTLGISNVRLQKNGNFTSFWEETVDTTSLIPQYCVQSDSNKFVTVTFPDGRVYKFQAGLAPQCQQAEPIIAPTLSFTELPGEAGTENATLTTADGVTPLVDGEIPGKFDLVQQDGTLYNPTRFNLTTSEGFTYTLDQKLGLVQVADLNGNTLTITPNGVIHSSGKSIVFHRDNLGRIASITDPQGHNLYYAYNVQTGDLQSSTDLLGNSTFYGYDTSSSRLHLLGTITDSRGVQVLRNVYSNSSPAELVFQQDGNVPIPNTINYNIQSAQNQETITDRNGNPTTYTYDDDGNVLTVVDALGHQSAMTYDLAGNKLTETHTDDAGRALTTAFTYDGQSNVTSQTDPLGNVTRYIYNARRQATSITDPRGKVTQNSYDGKGNLLSTVDPLGNTTGYTYLPSGLPQSVTDALKHSTSFQYDGNGNLTQQTDALGNVSSFTYDGNNNKLSQTVTRTKADGTTETLTTKYVYDALNRLIKTTNADGSFTQTSYNSIGKQAGATDARGNVTTYGYDSQGRLASVTYADQTADTFDYDNNGNRMHFFSHGTVQTGYSYDALNRQLLSFTGDQGAVVNRTAYDALGRVKSTTDPNGNVTHYGYDDAGRRTTVTDALGNVTQFAYDAAGNQTSMTDARGNTTQYVYDDAGRRTQTIFADQTTETIVYDALGRQTSRTDQAGKITQFAYDSLGRLTSVTQSPDGGATQLVTSYTYDELGNRVSQTDANGHTTSFAYDQLGRRIGRALPAGQSESYAYDAAGNMTSRTDFNGHTTTYTYNNMNRLTAKAADAFFSTGACAPTAENSFPCGATQITYSYTPTGKRAGMTDASGSWGYAYDGADRLTGKFSGQVQNRDLQYTYDLAGNVTFVHVQSGPDTGYSYDALNRLSTVTMLFAHPTYSYDPVGNLSQVDVPGVMKTSYNYDPLNRLTSMQTVCETNASGCGTAGTPMASYAYTLGKAGNRLSVTELSGRTVSYTYDDLYRLTSETIASATTQNGTIGYQYDAVGNRKQLSSTVPAIPASGLLNYDANDRTAIDPYDANGNLLNGGAGGNIYDFENRLVQAGGVQIVYDGDGNRVQETVAGTSTFYLISEINPTGYPQVLQEQSVTGVFQKSYQWGLELLDSITAVFVPVTPFFSQEVFVPAWYGHDGHGSVRYLTDGAGKITDTYDYDAFGNLLNSTGSSINNYLFAGEWFDPALGVYYNRARYYDERRGRFWTADTFEGHQQDPLSLHRYVYAEANPVGNVDPSGNQIDDLVASTAISMTLNALSTSILASPLGNNVGSFIASHLIPSDVLQGIANWTPDAVELGVYGQANLNLRNPFVGATGFGGAEFLESLKTGKGALYGYYGAGLTGGSTASGGGVGGTVGLVFDCPNSQDYTENFVTITIPQGTLSSSIRTRIQTEFEQVNTAIIAGGIPVAFASLSVALSSISVTGFSADKSINIFFSPYRNPDGSRPIGISVGVSTSRTLGPSTSNWGVGSLSYYWQLAPSQAVAFR